MKTARSNYKWFLNVFEQLLLPAVSQLDTTVTVTVRVRVRVTVTATITVTFKHGPQLDRTNEMPNEASWPF